MYRVKENHKKVSTNKSFGNRKNGGDTGPKAKELGSKAIPASNANQESKHSQMQKPYPGQKNNPGVVATNHELTKTYQKPKNKQEPKTYQQPMTYHHGPNNYISPGKYQVSCENKYKNFNKGAQSYQGSKVYCGPPKSYQFPRYYQKPRIYQPEGPFRTYKGNNKVPEISVGELCRTLSGLKVLEQANTNCVANNANQPNDQPNEPFFASNLEYYPHLPQVYYSEEYQTFAELKASVSQGDLSQVKPPANHDYRFVNDWRKLFQTTAQRQAYLRNQRALSAQRVGREQRHLREQHEEEDKKKKKPLESKEKLEAEPVLCSVLEEQQRLSAQQGLDDERRREEGSNSVLKEFIAGVPEKQQQALQDVKDVKEIMECKQKELEEQQELEARIQRQKRSMEFVAQLQMAFDEEKKQEEELEAEARRKEQARVRNERARTAQRLARETRQYYEQLEYDFRFGPKDLGQRDDDDATQANLENLSKMPTCPRAPLPSQLPKPMPSLINGKTTPGYGNGIGN